MKNSNCMYGCINVYGCVEVSRYLGIYKVIEANVNLAKYE